MTDYSQDTAQGEACPACGYTNGHNVESCPRVLSGQAKQMPGLPPDVVERLRGEGLTVEEQDHYAAD